jgi:predicted transcriptional regulator
MDINLTHPEAELMEILWQQGPSTVAEALAGFDDELAYTTVLTMLRTLETKGYVRHSTEGKAHRYEAAVARDGAQRSALRSLARKLFKGSTELLLSHLVADDKLTDAEIKRLRSLLDERARAGKRR